LLASTKSLGDSVDIKIRDNGHQHALDQFYEGEPDPITEQLLGR
jgi:hypothetical protein